MTGATEAQSRVAGNVAAFLRSRLRGSAFRAYGFGLALRTGERTVRIPKVSVYHHDPAGDGSRQLLGDPVFVMETLPPLIHSSHHDTKCAEYRTLAGVREVVLVEPTSKRIRLLSRRNPEDWSDHWLTPGADLTLASLGVIVPYAEIFAHD